MRSRPDDLQPTTIGDSGRERGGSASPHSRAMTSLLRPTRLGTILAVFAHPDDETYLAGGVMAAARAAGQRVVSVSLTAGERGTADPVSWPPARLAATRRWEAAAAMAALGVMEHHVLDHRDGELDRDDALARSRIGAMIDTVDPDSILTFGPDGATFHPDHIATHHLVTAAWERRGCRARLLYTAAPASFLDRYAERMESWGMYMTAERPAGVDELDLDLYLDLVGPDLDRKLVALRSMATQTAPVIAALGIEVYRDFVAEEAFVAAPPRGVTRWHHDDRSPAAIHAGGSSMRSS